MYYEDPKDPKDLKNLKDLKDPKDPKDLKDLKISYIKDGFWTWVQISSVRVRIRILSFS